MPDNLRETMVQAAAARYGQQHYRGILFWHSFGRLWWLLPTIGAIGGTAWLVHSQPATSGVVVMVGLVALAVLAWLLVRWLRSPYRRRRFRR